MRPSRWRPTAGSVLILVSLLTTACTGQAATPPPIRPSVPAFSHVYLLVLENKSLANVVDEPGLPFLNSLIAGYGLATNYKGISHPSQPNYIALFSGSTQGVHGDTPVNLSGRNLVDQLSQHNKSWRVFAQNVPLQCYLGETAVGGADGTGTYARRHEPAIEFTNISTSETRCSNILNFSHFDPSAADFEMIVPNTCNDMHDCPEQVGDKFLKTFLGRLLDSPSFQQGGVLFITFDESDEYHSTDSLVPLIVVSNQVRAGFRSTTPHDHYSLLRTIEDAWKLGCLAQTCKANNLAEFFQR